MFKSLNIKISDLLGATDPSDLIYADFLASTANKNAYTLITDMGALNKKISNTLSQCNDEIGGMNLVMFKQAI